MPTDSLEGSLRLCFARIENVDVAFAADDIQCFVEEEEESVTPDIDLPRLLRLNADTSLTSRRRARVAIADGFLEVALGSRLTLKTIASQSVRPLPRLLSALTASTGVTGIFEQEGQFTFLLDLRRVPSGPELSPPDKPRKTDGP